MILVFVLAILNSLLLTVLLLTERISYSTAFKEILVVSTLVALYQVVPKYYKFYKKERGR